MKKLAALTMMFLVTSLLPALSANAFQWKPKHFKGDYRCLASGQLLRQPILWLAVIIADGKGSFRAADAVVFSDGSATEAALTEGRYEMSADGILTFYAPGYSDAIMVQAGKGFQIGFVGSGAAIGGECWRER